MNSERRTQRLLAHLPQVLRGVNMRHLFRQLAEELTLAEDGVTRLMRSRWYRLARGWEDPADPHALKVRSELGALASAFGIEPLLGESVAMFRLRLRWLIAIHREGLTTASAILQLAASVYLPQKPPAITWEGDVAVASFTVATVSGARPVRLELRDNPRRVTTKRADGLRGGDRVRVVNAGLDDTSLEVHLTAVGGPVTLPQIVHEQSDMRVVYVGTLWPGETLRLRHRQRPTRDGRRDEADVLVFNPCVFDEPDARFWHQVKRRGEIVERGAYFSVFATNDSLPPLPTGESHWRIEPLTREALARYIGVDRLADCGVAAAGESQGAIDLEFRWQESIAACFELRAPVFVPPHLGEELSVLARALERVIDQGRAGGVEGRLAFTLPVIDERVEVGDSPRVDVALTLSESASASDHARATALVRLAERVDSDDRVYMSGGFDERRFDEVLYSDGLARGEEEPS